ncbi:ion channel [Enteractinococcus helveticum]
MFFTYFYHALALWTPEPIFAGGQPDHLTNIVFFSFTTLTTIGYGNMIPAGAGVQSIAIGEAITGQLFLIIAVAHVASGWSHALRNPTQ